MSNLQVHISNRMETLVGLLADRVAAPGGDPLAPEMIAVQGRGMERWLAMELSRRLGVWANPSFPFPRRLIETAFEAALGEAGPDASCFEPDVLRWSIASMLPDLIRRSDFVPLANSLRSDDSPLRRLQLASRIAEVFDRYLTYRPEMIRSWDRGGRDGAPAWQVALWRELVARHGEQHLAARAEAFVVGLGNGSRGLAGFPERLHVFGVTTLPPLFLDVLCALSQRVETHVYALGCTRTPSSATHPLWTSLGSVGREFRELIAERVDEDVLQQKFDDPGDETMLRALQRQVQLGGESVGSRCEDGDRSIQVHACHGPMREVEVLHDQLTQLFESDASLEPRDVVVMTPDIETYAPFIEAVFAFGPGGPGSLGQRSFGYGVADRGVRATHEIVDAFSRLLDALRSRLTASAVVDLLMVECIRTRFGIEAADLDVVTAWVRDAGIRWGVDADHREEVAQPRLSQNTWREGLDRLLLGIALPDDDDRLYRGTLRAEGVDPSRAELLGRFVDFCEALFACRERLQGEQGVDAWSRELSRVLAQMVDAQGVPGGGDGAAEQHARIRAALTEIALRAEEAGFRESAPLDLVLHELNPRLEQGLSSHRFLSGGVTFCEMVPMRSIPFRVVVLLGMADESFPRNRDPIGFDVVASNRRSGDRSARDDDRYLFLEAIVSARDHLLVTYSGRSLRDGSERAPSVVVSELLDELGPVREHVLTVHPRHSFSPRYFDGSEPRLASYSSADRDGAEALMSSIAAPARARVGFVRTPLPDDDALVEHVVQLDHLARFFEHPVRSFLQERLGLYLRDEVEDLEDREPMELDGLASWKLGDRLLRDELSESQREPATGRTRALLRAAGVLPFGAAGELELDRCAGEVAKLAAAVRALRKDDVQPSLAVDLTIGRWRIVGELEDLWPVGRVVFQYSKLPHRAELGFWVRHLVLNCLSAEGRERASFLVARDRGAKSISVLRLGELQDAASTLADLLELYEQGSRAPLHVLPRASRDQAAFGFKSGWPDGVAQGAIRSWESDSGIPAERRDPYLHQAFGDQGILESREFQSLARRIYEPYLAAKEDW